MVKCYFCESTNTRFCSICKKYMCDDCRKNYPLRVKGMIASLEKRIKSLKEGSQKQ